MGCQQYHGWLIGRRTISHESMCPPNMSSIYNIQGYVTPNYTGLKCHSFCIVCIRITHSYTLSQISGKQGSGPELTGVSVLSSLSLPDPNERLLLVRPEAKEDILVIVHNIPCYFTRDIQDYYMAICIYKIEIYNCKTSKIYCFTSQHEETLFLALHKTKWRRLHVIWDNMLK